jgi:hypothetical protein
VVGFCTGGQVYVGVPSAARRVLSHPLIRNQSVRADCIPTELADGREILTAKNAKIFWPCASWGKQFEGDVPLVRMVLKRSGRAEGFLWDRARFQRTVGRGVGRFGNQWFELQAQLGESGQTTEFFIQGSEVERIRFAGKWTNTRTLEHYIQEATATLVDSQITPKLQGRLHTILDQASQFAQPPTLPWTAFFSRARQFRAQARWH